MSGNWPQILHIWKEERVMASDKKQDLAMQRNTGCKVKERELWKETEDFPERVKKKLRWKGINSGKKKEKNVPVRENIICKILGQKKSAMKLDCWDYGRNSWKGRLGRNGENMQHRAYRQSFLKKQITKSPDFIQKELKKLLKSFGQRDREMTDPICYWGENTSFQCEEQIGEKQSAVWEEKSG